MIEFVTYLVKNLVDSPDAVSVETEERETDHGATTFILVKVAESDLGKVIGKSGNTINSLRTLALIMGARENKRVRLEVS